jgi:phosphotransacetylase
VASVSTSVAASRKAATTVARNTIEALGCAAMESTARTYQAARTAVKERTIIRALGSVRVYLIFDRNEHRASCAGLRQRKGQI